MGDVVDQLIVVHFSDTHFGEIMTDIRPSLFGGLAAHDLKRCLAMPAAFDEIRVFLGLQDEDIPYVMVSGDLTCSGSTKQFPVAYSFLQSQWVLRRTPPRRITGLAIPDDRLAIVPGNHDHWNHHMPYGYNGSLFPAYFERTPWRKLWLSSTGGLELELFGIDSNSSWKDEPLKFDPFARGGFAPDELHELETLLQQSEQQTVPDGVRRVRAIVTHHSPAYSKGLLVKELDRNSRQRLLDLAERYRVAAICTGHTHDFYLSPPSRTEPHGPFQVHELRSATTLQGDGEIGHNRESGFLLHRLWCKDGDPTWTTWPYFWANKRRFIRKDALKYEFRVI